MIAAKFLLVAMAACAKATPVATAPAPATTEWTALPVPMDSVNWDGIDMNAFNNPANWKNESSPEDTSSTSPNDSISIMSGPCEQGTCPDLFKAFDLVYTFVAVPVPGNPGDPPLTIFESKSDIRVNDCGVCLRHKVGSNLGLTVPGGCYDFTTCGRAQTICVDPGNYRAHRIWKDNGHKTCYRMAVEYLGECGFIKSRIIVYPTGTTACNW